MSKITALFDKPSYEVAVIQLECVKCGAQANATCSCGTDYRPIARAKEYAEANPGASVREIAEKTGVGHGTAQRARSAVPHGTPETVGRDGKSYPARKPKYTPDFDPSPLDYKLMDQAKKLILNMNRRSKGAMFIWLSAIIKGRQS